jgi:hypothetical protein
MVTGFSRELDALVPSQQVDAFFEETFARIPLGAIVNQTIVCLHADMDPSTESYRISQIRIVSW